MQDVSKDERLTHWAHCSGTLLTLEYGISVPHGINESFENFEGTGISVFKDS